MGKVSKLILGAMFSHLGLCFLITLYTVGGAFLFRALELSGEEERLNDSIKFANRVHGDYKLLATLKIKNATIFADKQGIEKAFADYHDQIRMTVKDHGYTGFVPEYKKHKYGWSIASSILFAASILTTIGYGHVFPVTDWGMITVILYALFAIPLMTMFLTNIGGLLADSIRWIYYKCSCGAKKAEKIKETRSDSVISENIDDEEEYYEEPKRSVPLTVSIAVVVVYIAVGIGLFTIFDSEWNAVNSAYFTFVTLLVIGFGDYVPGVAEGGVKGGLVTGISAIYIIVGLAVLTMGIELIIGGVTMIAMKLAEKKRIRQENEAAEAEAEMRV